jgi:hypothetical protein
LYEDIVRNQDAIDEIKETLLDFQEYVEKRMASLQHKLKAENNVFWCPDCNQDALITGNGEEPECLFCAEKKTAEGVAAIISEIEVKICPECGRQSLALRLRNNDKAEYYCVFCGSSGDYKECTRCGEMFSAESDSLICPNCLDSMLKSND